MAKPTKKKADPAKSASPKKTPAHAAAAHKAARKSEAEKRAPKSAAKTHSPDPMRLLGTNHRERKLDPFVKQQKEKLLQLRDAMVDSMAGVAQDTLRSRAEGSEASAFGMHQADAGSDAYDRDF